MLRSDGFSKVCDYEIDVFHINSVVFIYIRNRIPSWMGRIRAEGLYQNVYVLHVDFPVAVYVAHHFDFYPCGAGQRVVGDVWFSEDGNCIGGYGVIVTRCDVSSVPSES